VSAAAIHDEAVTLLIQLTAMAIALEPRTLVAPGLDDSAGSSAWQGLLVQLGEARPAWLELGGPQSFPALAAAAVSDETVSRLLELGSRVATLTRAGLSAPTEQLGALHETLLTLRFERLSARGVRLAASRHWVQAERVLEWPAPLRAKRLAREAGLSKRAVETLSAELATATSGDDVERALEPLLHERSGARPAGSWVLQPASFRRRSGAHYTPWPLCVALVERTLAPLVRGLDAPRTSEGLLALKVCDPAMGVGAFLVAAGDYLARALERALDLEADKKSRGASHALEARKLVVERVLLGVDKNPIAVALARLALSLFVDPTLRTPLALDRTLRAGDALVGAGLEPDLADEAPPRSRRGQRQAHSVARVLGDPRHAALDWVAAFPQAFARSEPGLDALVGNPPWVAFVGRAAQPLEPDLFEYFAATNPAFKRYRTLHGLFVYRCATLLRPHGRLGLILPTSVADLAGYSETRRAHDGLCVVDASLPDWGDGAFDGVFQPAMALVSTRRSQPSSPALGVWPLAGCELAPCERALLERLKALPKLPPHLFGERGFQTTEEDQAYLRRSQQGSETFRVALREGSDVREFRAAAPSLFVDPRAVVGRLRAAEQWRGVALLIRQTARFPIAAMSDGQAFRNSILAGFSDEAWPAPLLLVYLNSALARWLHYTLHRDAREGMPQLKIAHLRALPALPREQAKLVVELERTGVGLASRNLGLTASERALLDRLVCDAFELDAQERAAVLSWASAHPPPEPRARAPRAAVSAASAG
jgi:hypothetical protein